MREAKSGTPFVWGKKASINRVLFSLMVVCFLVVNGWCRRPVELFGDLSINNKRIVDKNGDPVQLRGMSLFWSQHGHRFWNANVVKWLRDDWKIDVIRAPMGVMDEEGVGYISEPNIHKTYVNRVVQGALEHGVYVIIDWHDHAAHKYTTQAKQFFSEMAQEYGDTPNVIYEIYNEPEYVDWNTVKNYANQVISSIRAHDPDNLILVGTPEWSQQLDQAINNPISGTNIVYTFHFYANSHSGIRWQLENAIGKIPVFVTEWGGCNYDGNGYFNTGETNNWLRLMWDNKISWCKWSIMAKDETSAALKVGASSQGGWTSSDLSESGKFIRTYLRGNTKIELPICQERPKGIRLYMSDKEIHLFTGEGAVAKAATLYNLQGRNIVNMHSAGKGHFTIQRKALKPGVWIVRTGEQAVKFLVK